MKQHDSVNIRLILNCADVKFLPLLALMKLKDKVLSLAGPPLNNDVSIDSLIYGDNISACCESIMVGSKKKSDRTYSTLNM